MQLVPVPTATRVATTRRMRRTLQVLGLCAAALVVAGGLITVTSGVWSTSASAHTASAAAANPLTKLVRSASDWTPIVGRVEQQLVAGRYTYLAVRTQQAELIWTVTLGSGRALGAQVRVRSMGRSKNFHSRRLQRTFPELVFGIVSNAD